MRGPPNSIDFGREHMVTAILILLTIGNPLKTKEYKDPVTNKRGNYKPSPTQILGDPELQDWLFKDWNYAAWLWVKGNFIILS
jgi:hypothetical protein